MLEEIEDDAKEGVGHETDALSAGKFGPHIIGMQLPIAGKKKWESKMEMQEGAEPIALLDDGHMQE